ncbi:transcriptional regulator [Paenibacillus sp. 598K]|nr:transcriptional regulator [Paenibacillus sp. 598K]
MREYNRIMISSDCYLDLDRQVVLKRQLPISLSRLQYRLIYRLAVQMNQIVSSKDLIQYIWLTHMVDNSELYMLIHRVRKQIEDNPKHPKHLITLRRKGYILYSEIP